MGIARIAVPATAGVAQPSFAMVDKITTVRRSNLETRIGRVSTTLMADIERSLMVFLGLAA
ncbi:type II toxin-antitoxin system PemK/MazF family toxin [Mycobacterium malmoense]|uniref:type II toxin-antitoxin system PemK/MazF family toxin n=1 Tax=Mycobacterium malmoense TaxID=1780 RepID=UPI0020CAC62A|nr:type II toxin-antitoxin system PemK/MazF family toxin [Mycobacterium malmoense]